MREIPLTRGRVTLVDEEDAKLVLSAGSWHLSLTKSHEYAGNSRVGRLHTFLTGWGYVDHINGDGLDNRRANLRPATPEQNAANARRSSLNKSGYKGVSLHKPTGLWRAYIGGARSRREELGLYRTAEEAALAYDAAALARWGDYARPNFAGGAPTIPAAPPRPARRNAKNTSGYRGVSLHRASGRWQAGIRLDGKRRALGLFDTAEEAAAAYDDAALLHLGHRAWLNFPTTGVDPNE